MLRKICTKECPINLSKMNDVIYYFLHIVFYIIIFCFILLAYSGKKCWCYFEGRLFFFFLIPVSPGFRILLFGRFKKIISLSDCIIEMLYFSSLYHNIFYTQNHTSMNFMRIIFFLFEVSFTLWILLVYKWW